MKKYTLKGVTPKTVLPGNQSSFYGDTVFTSMGALKKLGCLIRETLDDKSQWEATALIKPEREPAFTVYIYDWKQFSRKITETSNVAFNIGTETPEQSTIAKRVLTELVKDLERHPWNC